MAHLRPSQSTQNPVLSKSRSDLLSASSSMSHLTTQSAASLPDYEKLPMTVKNLGFSWRIKKDLKRFRKDSQKRNITIMAQRLKLVQEVAVWFDTDLKLKLKDVSRVDSEFSTSFDAGSSHAEAISVLTQILNNAYKRAAKLGLELLKIMRIATGIETIWKEDQSALSSLEVPVYEAEELQLDLELWNNSGSSMTSVFHGAQTLFAAAKGSGKANQYLKILEHGEVLFENLMILYKDQMVKLQENKLEAEIHLKSTEYFLKAKGADAQCQKVTLDISELRNIRIPDVDSELQEAMGEQSLIKGRLRHNESFVQIMGSRVSTTVMEEPGTEGEGKQPTPVKSKNEINPTPLKSEDEDAETTDEDEVLAKQLAMYQNLKRLLSDELERCEKYVRDLEECRGRWGDNLVPTEDEEDEPEATPEASYDETSEERYAYPFAMAGSETFRKLRGEAAPGMEKKKEESGLTSSETQGGFLSPEMALQKTTPLEPAQRELNEAREPQATTEVSFDETSGSYVYPIVKVSSQTFKRLRDIAAPEKEKKRKVTGSTKPEIEGGHLSPEMALRKTTPLKPARRKLNEEREPQPTPEVSFAETLESYVYPVVKVSSQTFKRLRDIAAPEKEKKRKETGSTKPEIEGGHLSPEMALRKTSQRKREKSLSLKKRRNESKACSATDVVAGPSSSEQKRKSSEGPRPHPTVKYGSFTTMSPASRQGSSVESAWQQGSRERKKEHWQLKPPESKKPQQKTSASRRERLSDLNQSSQVTATTPDSKKQLEKKTPASRFQPLSGHGQESDEVKDLNQSSQIALTVPDSKKQSSASKLEPLAGHSRDESETDMKQSSQITLTVPASKKQSSASRLEPLAGHSRSETDMKQSSHIMLLSLEPCVPAPPPASLCQDGSTEHRGNEADRRQSSSAGTEESVRGKGKRGVERGKLDKDQPDEGAVTDQADVRRTKKGVALKQPRLKTAVETMRKRKMLSSHAKASKSFPAKKSEEKNKLSKSGDQDPSPALRSDRADDVDTEKEYSELSKSLKLHAMKERFLQLLNKKGKKKKKPVETDYTRGVKRMQEGVRKGAGGFEDVRGTVEEVMKEHRLHTHVHALQDIGWSTQELFPSAHAFQRFDESMTPAMAKFGDLLDSTLYALEGEREKEQDELSAKMSDPNMDRWFKATVSLTAEEMKYAAIVNKFVSLWRSYTLVRLELIAKRKPKKMSTEFSFDSGDAEKVDIADIRTIKDSMPRAISMKRKVPSVESWFNEFKEDLKEMHVTKDAFEDGAISYPQYMEHMVKLLKLECVLQQKAKMLGNSSSDLYVKKSLNQKMEMIREKIREEKERLSHWDHQEDMENFQNALSNLDDLERAVRLRQEEISLVVQIAQAHRKLTSSGRMWTEPEGSVSGFLEEIMRSDSTSVPERRFLGLPGESLQAKREAALLSPAPGEGQLRGALARFKSDSAVHFQKESILVHRPAQVSQSFCVPSLVQQPKEVFQHGVTAVYSAAEFTKQIPMPELVPKPPSSQYPGPVSKHGAVIPFAHVKRRKRGLRLHVPRTPQRPLYPVSQQTLKCSGKFKEEKKQVLTRPYRRKYRGTHKDMTRKRTQVLSFPSSLAMSDHQDVSSFPVAEYLPIRRKRAQVLSFTSRLVMPDRPDVSHYPQAFAQFPIRHMTPQRLRYRLTVDAQTRRFVPGVEHDGEYIVLPPSMYPPSEMCTFCPLADGPEDAGLFIRTSHQDGSIRVLSADDAMPDQRSLLPLHPDPKPAETQRLPKHVFPSVKLPGQSQKETGLKDSEQRASTTMGKGEAAASSEPLQGIELKDVALPQPPKLEIDNYLRFIRHVAAMNRVRENIPIEEPAPEGQHSQSEVKNVLNWVHCDNVHHPTHESCARPLTACTSLGQQRKFQSAIVQRILRKRPRVRSQRLRGQGSPPSFTVGNDDPHLQVTKLSAQDEADEYQKMYAVKDQDLQDTGFQRTPIQGCRLLYLDVTQPWRKAGRTLQLMKDRQTTQLLTTPACQHIWNKFQSVCPIPGS